MPELPEVESIRRSLEPRLLGRVVRDASLHRRDVLVLPGDPFGGIARQRSSRRSSKLRRVVKADLLAGETVVELRRRGKQLALVGSSGRVLIVQLGMSGQLFHRRPGQRAAQTDHIHASWRFDDGRLLFRDPRRFGGLRSLPNLEGLEALWAELGPDALSVTTGQLADALADSARPIKAALLDQAVIAGVGNIYADEALYLARIAPHRPSTQITTIEIVRLATSIGRVLSQAIEAGGSTLRDYVDANGDPGTYQLDHAVYGRAGQPCQNCGRPLTQGVLAQRTSVWCAACQR